MSNEQLISSILKATSLNSKITDIQWKTQDAGESSLLFYWINDDAVSIAAFKERISHSAFAWLVVNKPLVDLPSNSTVIDEALWAETQKNCLDVVYPLPVLKFMALTGTNGKTTTTDLILQLGELMGRRGLSIGTLGVRENHKTILDFGLTSPSLIDLRKFLFLYGQDKDFCVLEASSHALLQKRLWGLEFDGVGWTSFSQDHLDYHHSMEAYFEAKCLLFEQMKPLAKAYVPREQEQLFDMISNKFSRVCKTQKIEGELPVFFQAKFNRNNLEVAVSILEDVFKEKVPERWQELTPTDGRFYIRSYKSNYIIIDFAHTPDALDNICQGIREAFPDFKLKTLFGCGGDRDRTKRPLMGSIAERWSDEIYLTSDNPRSEEPMTIISDIAAGIQHKNFQQIVERPKAVQTALSELKEKEVLLLAGKGHEDYILIKGTKHPYSDIQEVESFLTRNKHD